MGRWGAPAVVLAALLAAACGEPTTDAELALSAGDCAAADFAQVDVISVEVYGRSGGDLCVLHQRCLFSVDAASVDDIGEALAEASQPLVDVEDPDAAFTLSVIGHTTGCFGYADVVMWGSDDLANADDGTLDIALSCEPCPDDPIPFCP
jgi:hypothetical protein